MSTSADLTDLIEAIALLYQAPELQTAYLQLFKQRAAGGGALHAPAPFRDCRHEANSTGTPHVAIPDGVLKVMRALEELKIRRITQFYVVDPDYYDWTLQARVFRLTAPSVAHLCKCVVMENTRSSHQRYDSVADSRYYCIVVQYISSIDTARLTEFVRQQDGYTKGKKKYNFRLVDSDMSLALTGYSNNAVSPFGLNHPIPIILDKSIDRLSPPVLYLGAGHADWKLALPITEFKRATGCSVVDLSPSQNES
ncbi:hypothetical protein H4R33_001350 [Dimargaris cristalligena]|nr:hypothetical protein H4R33_001350 [Dimargaris cristalligena]